jgi:hypothetical protein
VHAVVPYLLISPRPPSDECKYAFETLNVGSGAMFHELGHALNNVSISRS